jgi:hypothetical protein
MYTPIEVIVQFLIGLAFWTLTEYVAHRYLLHGTEFLSENPSPDELTKSFRKHQIHHAFIN